MTKAVGLPDNILGIRADHAVAPASLYAAFARLYIPSFSRQSKLACSACHYQFPQLYVAYNRFNGASNDYDGVGRKAADNNTLFLYLWFAF